MYKERSIPTGRNTMNPDLGASSNILSIRSQPAALILGTCKTSESGLLAKKVNSKAGILIAQAADSDGHNLNRNLANGVIVEEGQDYVHHDSHYCLSCYIYQSISYASSSEIQQRLATTGSDSFL